MTIEFCAICPKDPDPILVARMVEAVLGGLFGAATPIAVEVRDEGATAVRFGGVADVFVLSQGPGLHEFADSWVVTAAVGERNELSWLLAIVFAAVAAVLTAGQFWDEAGLLSSELSAAGLLGLVIAAAPASPDVLLAALKAR